ncbi:MAG: LysM peptidoglycan-binding domain-containing protein [Planctomycetes bacterium]|nr:LysM peptidoglycan-binding domain-containing protein [Planctomycetota bacterium]
MDRGVKIAIFVASIASLGLGLIWDQVLSHARVLVEDNPADVLAPEVIDARVGSPDIARLNVPDELDPQFPIPNLDTLPPAEAEPVQVDAPWTDYVVQNGDSWWKLAHVTFKNRELSSSDLERANHNVTLVPGKTIKIPPNKEALKGGAPAPVSERTEAGAGTGSETEYIVKDGDSWWKIAYVHFKDRGITSDDVANANPGVKLRAGVKVKIPAGHQSTK